MATWKQIRPYHDTQLAKQQQVADMFNNVSGTNALFRSIMYLGILLTLLVLSVSSAFAQEKWVRGFWNAAGSNAGEYYEFHRIYVGITTPTITSSRYTYVKAKDWSSLSVDIDETRTNKQISNIESGAGYEIGFGLPVRVRLNDYLSLSSGVKWNVFQSLNARATRLEFGILDETDPQIKTSDGNSQSKSNFLSLEYPLSLQLYSDRKYIGINSGNPVVYRAYLLGGVHALNYINAKRNYEKLDFNNYDTPIILKPWSYSYHVGLGLDFIFPYFKVSPEIRFSQSINNMLDHKRHRDIVAKQQALPGAVGNYQAGYMNALKHLGINKIQFSIILE